MPALGSSKPRTLVHVLMRPGVGIGALATTLVFTRQFALFTLAVAVVAIAYASCFVRTQA